MAWNEIIKCKSCGADIKFIKTFKGKWLPVNPTPLEMEIAMGGKILVLDSGHILSDKYNKIKGYVAHWTTCPNAEEFRKKKDEPKQEEIPASEVKFDSSDDIPF